MTEEAPTDLLDGIILRDNPLGFTGLTPIDGDGLAAGLEDRHMELIIGKELHSESVNEAVDMGGMEDCRRWKV